MTRLRTKLLARNIVDKSDGSPSLFIGLESIEGGVGRLSVSELPMKQAEDSLRHRQGDVLFSKLRPYLAKSILAHQSGTGTGELLVLRPGAQIEPRYLFYNTLSRPWLEWAEMTSYGSKMPRTSWEAMGEFPLWLPSLEEQRRIADFLDAETARIDELRRLANRQIRCLDARFAELMRSSTIGFAEPMKDTGIPWMPTVARSWRLVKLSHLFRSGSGTTPTASNPDYFDGGILWVSSGDICDGWIAGTSRTITPLAVEDFSSLRRHPAGSLVVAMYGQGETKGRVGLLGEDAYVNQACCVLTPLGGMLSEFAFFWFRAHKEGIVSLALGAGQPNLAQDVLRDIRIPAPELDVQHVVVSRLRQSEKRIAAQKALLSRRDKLLAERRQGIITAAVTGQLDVSTARGADLS